MQASRLADDDQGEGMIWLRFVQNKSEQPRSWPVLQAKRRPESERQKGDEANKTEPDARWLNERFRRLTVQGGAAPNRTF